jgi:hypothetical protein
VDDVAFMRGFNPVDQLLDDRQCLVEWHRAAERRALHELHHQVVGADVVEVADVAVIERGDRSGFPGKTIRERLVRNLIATSRPRRESWALNTSPMPPCPIRAVI